MSVDGTENDVNNNNNANNIIFTITDSKLKAKENQKLATFFS